MNTVEKDFRQYRSNIAKLPERYDIEREAWHTAAKKYQERIEELETRLHFSELAYKGCEQSQIKLESENAKLVECVERVNTRSKGDKKYDCIYFDTTEVLKELGIE